MRRLSIFSELSIIGLVFEIVVIFFVFVSIGYFSTRTDPLLIHSDINILLILISVITLFYGLLAGLIIITILFIGLYYFYKPFPYNIFINNLLFMLIFSEFHFFWNRTLNKLKKENDYLDIRFRELTKSFYLLKLSHDQMEKTYILKPQSIRNVINQIKNIYLNNKENAYQELLTVISKNFKIRKALIIQKNKDSFKVISSIGELKDLKVDSKVIEKAIETELPTFLSSFEDMKHDYLSAVPAYDYDSNLKFIMLIEDMQFLDFNKENIFSIWIILNYFADFVSNLDNLNSIKTDITHCPVEIIIEIKRLSFLRKKLDIKSIIMMINLKKVPVEANDIVVFLSKNLRSLDVVYVKGNTIFIIFPLVSYANIETVSNKIIKDIKEKFLFNNKDISYSFLEVLDDSKKTINYLKEIALKNNESK